MKLFYPFKPMEPRISKEDLLKESTNYIYQIKWDGIRGLIHTDGNKVRVFSKNMKELSLQFPELQCLKKLKKSIILDGEIIVLQDNKPNFFAALKRNSIRNPIKIKSIQMMFPIQYCIFDIISLEEKSFIQMSWEERNIILKSINKLQNLEYIHITESFTDGQDLFKYTKENNMEGIVAKDINSTYDIGGKSDKWLKVKNRRRINCIICGYKQTTSGVKSIILGSYIKENKKLCFIGSVSTGLSLLVLQEFAKAVQKLRITTIEIENFPTTKEAKVVWIKPILTMEIEYAEWTNTGRLRSPVFKKFLSINPQECII